VRGKYYAEASAGTNLVLIDPDLAEVFPSAQSVNRALRALRDTAASAVSGQGRNSPNKRLQRTAAIETSRKARKAHRGGGR